MSADPKRPDSKKWTHLAKLAQRKRGVRELHERFLIVCEDDKSAPNYFHALKKHEKLAATSIEILPSKGRTQPQQVVDAAIKRKERAASTDDSGTEPFDQVWCIIDGDYDTKVNNARASADAHGIKLAVSTKCFEYWILLHFAENATPSTNCDEVVSTLKTHQPNYTKGGCDFEKIVPNVRIASARAKKLRRTSELPENQNPCSDVYLLIDAILGATPPTATGQPPSAPTLSPKPSGKKRSPRS